MPVIKTVTLAFNIDKNIKKSIQEIQNEMKQTRFDIQSPDPSLLETFKEMDGLLDSALKKGIDLTDVLGRLSSAMTNPNKTYDSLAKAFTEASGQLKAISTLTDEELEKLKSAGKVDWNKIFGGSLGEPSKEVKTFLVDLEEAIKQFEKFKKQTSDVGSKKAAGYYARIVGLGGRSRLSKEDVQQYDLMFDRGTTWLESKQFKMVHDVLNATRANDTQIISSLFKQEIQSFLSSLKGGGGSGDGSGGGGMSSEDVGKLETAINNASDNIQNKIGEVGTNIQNKIGDTSTDIQNKLDSVNSDLKGVLDNINTNLTTPAGQANVPGTGNNPPSAPKNGTPAVGNGGTPQSPGSPQQPGQPTINGANIYIDNLTADTVLGTTPDSKQTHIETHTLGTGRKETRTVQVDDDGNITTASITKTNYTVLEKEYVKYTNAVASLSKALDTLREKQKQYQQGDTRYDAIQKQIDAIEKQRKAYEDLADARKKEAEARFAEDSGYTQAGFESRTNPEIEMHRHKLDEMSGKQAEQQAKDAIKLANRISTIQSKRSADLAKLNSLYSGEQEYRQLGDMLNPSSQNYIFGGITNLEDLKNAERQLDTIFNKLNQKVASMHQVLKGDHTFDTDVSAMRFIENGQTAIDDIQKNYERAGLSADEATKKTITLREEYQKLLEMRQSGSDPTKDIMGRDFDLNTFVQQFDKFRSLLKASKEDVSNVSDELKGLAKLDKEIEKLYDDLYRAREKVVKGIKAGENGAEVKRIEGLLRTKNTERLDYIKRYGLSDSAWTAEMSARNRGRNADLQTLKDQTTLANYNDLLKQRYELELKLAEANNRSDNIYNTEDVTRYKDELAKVNSEIAKFKVSGTTSATEMVRVTAENNRTILDQIQNQYNQRSSQSILDSHSKEYADALEKIWEKITTINSTPLDAIDPKELAELQVMLDNMKELAKTTKIVSNERITKQSNNFENWLSKHPEALNNTTQIEAIRQKFTDMLADPKSSTKKEFDDLIQLINTFKTEYSNMQKAEKQQDKDRTASLKEYLNILKQRYEIQQQILNLEKNIESLDANQRSDSQDRIESLRKRLNELKTDAEQLRNVLGLEGQNAREQQFINPRLSAINDQYQSLTAPDRLNKYTTQYKKDLKKIGDELLTINQHPLELATPETLARLQLTLDGIKQIGTEQQIVNSTTVKKQQTNFENWLSRNGQAVEKYTAQITELRQRFQDFINIPDSAKPKEFNKLIGDVASLETRAAIDGNLGDSIFGGWRKKMVGIGQYLASFVSFYKIIGTIRQVISSVQQLNASMVEMSKTAGTSIQTIESKFQDFYKISLETGGTINDTIKATTDWIRNGFDIPQSEELARVAQIYKNVGYGVDINSANEYLISILRGFNMQADQAMTIIDKINEVGNNFPIDQRGIGEALQRSSASFAAANTNLSQSIALITAAKQYWQSI